VGFGSLKIEKNRIFVKKIAPKGRIPSRNFLQN